MRKLKHADDAVAEYFAGKLMLMDQSTIQLAQLAEERSTNEKVKQFAKMLADEHMKCNEKLRECALASWKSPSCTTRGITHAAGFFAAQLPLMMTSQLPLIIQRKRRRMLLGVRTDLSDPLESRFVDKDNEEGGKRSSRRRK